MKLPKLLPSLTRVLTTGHRSVRTFAALFGVAMLVSNCKNDTVTGPSPATVSSVSLAGAPADGVILVGQTSQLVATPKDATGVALTNKSVVWTTSNAAIASVSSSGLVAGASTGVATITATTEGKNSSVDFSVRVPLLTPAAGATQPVVTTVLNGAVIVSVPPGATTAGTVLSVAPASAAAAPAVPELLGGTAFTFGPEGTQFATPITLSLKFDPTGLSTNDIAGLAIYLAAGGDWTEVSGSTIGAGNLVSAPITHFSTYAILRRAAPATVTISAGNNQAASTGAAVAVSPSVVVRDARNRSIRNVPVAFAVTGGGGSVTGASATTDASGIATVGSWTLGPAAGSNTLSAAVASLSPVTFTATGVAASTPAIALSSTTATFGYSSGGAVPAAQSINVTNSAGGTLSGLTLGTVTYSAAATGWLNVSLSGTAAPATLSLSVVPGSLGVGTYTATVPVQSAVASNSPQNVSVTFVITAGGGSVLGIVTQPAGAHSGDPFDTQPVIDVRDGAGRRVTTPEVDVTAAITLGSGTLVGVKTIHTVGGVATFTNLGVNGSGTMVITFSSAGLASVASAAFTVPVPLTAIPNTVSFSAGVGGAATPASVPVAIGSGINPINGLALGTILYGPGATGWLNVGLSGNVTPATLTLSAVTGALAAGTYTATVPVLGAGSATTNVTVTFTVNALPPTQLVLTSQPSGAAESGVPFAQQPVVELRNTNNVKVNGAVNAVTAALASGTGTLSGTTTISAVNGVAAFTDLKIAGTGAHTFTFTATALTSATSGTVTVTQVVRQLVITTQPNGAVSGVTFTTQPVIALRDQAGLVVTGSAAAITAAVATGTGALSGTTTVNAVAGIATFTNLKITGSGAHTLQFSGAGAPNVTSTPFGVTVAPPTQLAITAQPSANAESGFPFAVQPVVEIRDVANALVAGATNPVTAAIFTGTGALAGTVTVNAVGGVATFTNLQLNGAPGSFTLQFTSAGLTSVNSGTIALTQQVRSVAITTQPGGAQSGSNLSPQPVITLKDQAGLTVLTATSTVTATKVSGPGVLSGTTALAAVAGVANFTNLVITGPGTHTLSFSITVPSALSATSGNVVIAALPATQLFVATQPAGAESGVNFTTQPVVQVRDALNGVVAGATDLVTAAITSGTGTLSGTTAVNAVNGVATFTNLKIAGSGSHVITFTSGALTSGASGSFTVTQVVRSLLITTQPGGAVSGFNFTSQPVMVLRDGAGLTMSAATDLVTAVVNTGTGVLSGGPVNAVAGIATFANLKITGTGAHTLSFSTATTLSPAISSSFTVTSAPATQLFLATQPSGAAESGVAFGTQPVVQVRDALNGVVAGAVNAVTAALASGTGTLSGTTTISAVNGVATFTDLKIAGSGAHTINFTASGLTGAGPSGTVTVTQVVRSVTISTQPGGAVSGSVLAPQPVITLKDQAGLTVTTAANAVTAAVASGPGALGGTTSINAVAGVATFTNLVITGAGTHTLSFTIAGPLSATSVSIGITAAPATQLAIVTQPGAASESGVAFGTQPVIEVRDATNTKVVGATNSVTASVFSGSGALVGTTTVNAVNGTATFTNLQINGLGAHTIAFAASLLTGATSGTITVSQVVRSVAITTQPGGAASGSTLAPQPVITLRDQAGLTVTGAASTVTAAKASGPGALSGTTAVAAVAGVATFTNLVITGAGTHTLSFSITVPSALSATSGNVVITALPASQLAITTQPSAAPESGFPFGTQPVVEIRDATNTLVSGATNAVTAAILTGTGALLGTATVNAVGGIATFTNLQLNGAAGSFTLQFTSGALASATSSSIALSQVVRSVSIATSPGGAQTGANLAPQPVITLKDQAGLTVSAATSTVTAAKASGPGTLGGTTAVAAVSGVATFTNLNITGAGTYTISFSITVPSALSATSGSVVITSLPATQLAVVTQPSTTAESGVVFGAQPVIEIRDATNTKVAGAINSVTVSLASGSGTLVGTTTVAAVNGTATFTNLQINGTGAHTLQFISGVLAGANSGTITVSQVVRTVAITTQPGGALSGASLSPQPVITLRDQAGLTVSAATNSVTAAVASGTGALSGTTSLNAVAGVATFTDLKITGSGSHTLSFTIAGPLSATSGSFTITAVATKIAIVTQPAGATESGVVFPTQPVIEIQDATSTRVPGATNAVTVSLASGTGALSGTLTVAAVNGTATFTDLKIAGSGAHTLSFTSGVLTGAGPSGTVTVTQVVRSVSITTQPGGALSGSILSTQPVITLKDQAGLTVASATSTVTAAKASGPGVLGGTVAVAAVGGVATFADLKITGAGTHTISFSITVPSALSAISGNVVITAPPPPSFALDITGPASVSLVSGGVSAGVTLTITNGSGAVGANAGAAQFDLTWDKTKFTFVSVVGSGLPAGCSPSIGPPDLVNGKVTVGFTCTTGLTATQSLFTLSLIASATGSGSVGASNLIAADELANTIAVPVHSLTVTITP